VLPQVLQEADSEFLAKPLEEHLVQTRAQAERLEGVFLALGVEPSSNRSEALAGLIREHDLLAGKVVEPRLKDIFLAGAAAKTEHLELALYDALLVLAPEVGVESAPLALTRDEEEQALRHVEEAATKLRERLPVA
jgi:ferritin-like metal-binding protein YciE